MDAFPNDFEQLPATAPKKPAAVDGMEENVRASLQDGLLFGTLDDRQGEFTESAEKKLAPWQRRVLERVGWGKLMNQAWTDFVKAVRTGRKPKSHATFVSFLGYLIKIHALPSEREWPPPRVHWKRPHSREDRYPERTA